MLQVLLLLEMLRAEPWCFYPLTLQFLSSQHSALRGKCPPPPEHMQVLVAPMEVRLSLRACLPACVWNMGEQCAIRQASKPGRLGGKPSKQRAGMQAEWKEAALLSHLTWSCLLLLCRAGAARSFGGGARGVGA